LTNIKERVQQKRLFKISGKASSAGASALSFESLESFSTTQKRGCGR